MTINKANLQKALVAARSGTYTYKSGALRSGSKFGFLGLLCEVYRLETGRGSWKGETFSVTVDGKDHSHPLMLPQPVKDWYGFPSPNLAIDGVSLKERTDDLNWDLSKIADDVESYYIDRPLDTKLR